MVPPRSIGIFRKVRTVVRQFGQREKCYLHSPRTDATAATIADTAPMTIHRACLLLSR
jgi:hypothetical protein